MNFRCGGVDDESDMEDDTYSLTADDNGCSGTVAGTSSDYPIPAPDGSAAEYYSATCTLEDTVGEQCTALKGNGKGHA